MRLVENNRNLANEWSAGDVFGGQIWKGTFYYLRCRGDASIPWITKKGKVHCPIKLNPGGSPLLLFLKGDLHRLVHIQNPISIRGIGNRTCETTISNP